MKSNAVSSHFALHHWHLTGLLHWVMPSPFSLLVWCKDLERYILWPFRDKYFLPAMSMHCRPAVTLYGHVDLCLVSQQLAPYSSLVLKAQRWTALTYTWRSLNQHLTEAFLFLVQISSFLSNPQWGRSSIYFIIAAVFGIFCPFLRFSSLVIPLLRDHLFWTAHHSFCFSP